MQEEKSLVSKWNGWGRAFVAPFMGGYFFSK